MDLFDNAVEAGTATVEDFGLTPYEVPSMEDVRNAPWNGLTVVGSFSGCGGSSLGLRMAGFRVPYAIEFIEEAARTYQANSPSTFVDERDIRKIDAKDILDRIGMRAGELDVFEGSPPCASFSSAGNREKSWGEEKKYSDSSQRTDDLFFEWMRILEGLQPRAFIAENVPGMTTGRALEEYTRVITKKLAALGYYVRATILNATWYGVPQERRRILFVGVRKDLVDAGQAQLPTWPPPVETSVPHTAGQALDLVDPGDPDHSPYVAESSMEGKAVGRTWAKMTRDGAEWIDPESLGRKCETCGEQLDRGHTVPVTLGAVKELREAGRLPEGGYETHAGKVERWVPLAEAERHVQQGGESRGITSSGKVKKARCADGREAVIVKAYFMLTVPKLDKPFPTLTATGAQVGAASVTHPTECRKLTPAEAKAACSFPQDFELTGSREQRYERMGRAVPPLMMRAVGRAVARALGAVPS